MSKKTMMKRSLALGALMAFVITGSAIAAENLEVYTTTNGIGFISENDCEYGNVNIELTSPEPGGDNRIKGLEVKNSQLVVDELLVNVQNNITNIKIAGINLYDATLIANGDVDIRVVSVNENTSEGRTNNPFGSGLAVQNNSKAYFNGDTTNIYMENTGFTAQGVYVGSDVYFNSKNTTITAKSDYGVSGIIVGGTAYFGNDVDSNKIDTVTINALLTDKEGCSAVGVMTNIDVASNVDNFVVNVEGSGSSRENGTAGIFTGGYGDKINIRSNNLTVTVNGGVDYSATAQNGFSLARDNTHGIKAINDANVTVGENTTTNITVNDNGKGEAAGTAYGVYAEGGAEVSILGNATIKATSGESKEAYSLYVTGKDTEINIGSPNKMVDLTGTIIADYGGLVEINGKTVDIKANQGKYAFGIQVGDGDYEDSGTVKIGSDVEYTTINAENAIYSSGAKGVVDIESKNLIVNAQDYGLWLNQAGTVKLGNKDNIIDKLVVNAALDGGTGLAMYASGNSKIDVFSNKVDINSNRGLMVRRGKINIGTDSTRLDTVNIITKGQTIYGDDNTTESDQSIINLYAKKMTLQTTTEGELCINARNSEWDSSDGAVITVNATDTLKLIGGVYVGEDKSEVNINEGIDGALVTIDGDITADEGAINLNLGTTGSTLTSTITDNAKGVSLNLNKGTWNVTGASTLNSLESTNGVISFAADADAHIESADGSVVLTETGKTADDFSTADQLSAVANKLDVTQKASKTLSAKVVMAEGAVKGETTGIVTFADTDNDDYLNGQVLEKPVEKTNPTNASINNMLNVALMAWRAENNDMNKRLGELRDANGEHGVWVRMVNGESEYKDVENEYKTYQLGYDEKLSVDPSWTVGAAVSYTEGDTDAAKASGENKHKGFSIYGSKLNDDGSFVDLIAKVARIEHDFNIAGEKGDWDSNGYSFSAEYGKRLQQGNGLWIEPQVELTYGKISSAECELAGRNVTLEDMESLVGRVGFSLGKDIKQGNVYARASYLYDFEGETTTTFSNATDSRSFEQDLGGGWWEVGVGANINLSKATYIYADVEKTFGGEVDTNWQWNLGVRYSF